MDKMDLLWVRAIKSKDSLKRAKSVYRRFYNVEELTYRNLVIILSDICSKYNLICIEDLIDDLNPENRWKYGASKNGNYHETVAKALISTIKLTPVAEFPDFIYPARFRKSL